MRQLCCAALFALILVVLAGAAKINTPRVLLPWLGVNTRVNFTFEIFEGGCYTWSLSRDDLVSLEPLYEDSWGHCSRSAVVTPLASCSPPGSVIILAEDVITGEILRGDVNVHQISTVKITSTTWKLYLEEAPEAFEVEVFDEHGNKFSSLEGVKFEWTVENKEDKKDEEPGVKLVWWRDTDYEAPRGISELESIGHRSYSVLLYGQTMGEAKVTVCLNTTCADVALRVVASVILQPSIAVIAPGDAVRFKVVRARRGKLTVEDVADTLYRLNVPEDGITYLEDAVSLVQGKTLGTTSISLISGSTEVASSTVTVSSPHSIRVILRPSELLVQGEPFIVRALVLDKQGRALTAGEKMLVRLSVEGDADVQLLHSTENGTLTDAIPYAIGSMAITAYLHSVGGTTLTKMVQGSAEATVVEPLKVVPSELYIAWTDTPIEVQLSHTGGGEGPVSWSMDGTTGQLAVSAEGKVRAESLGRATVRAQLTQHTHVRGDSEVWVLEAQYVQVASSGRARVGRTHDLHVALTGTQPDTGRLFTFHRCDCNSFAVTLLEGPEPQNITAATWIEPLEGACCVLTMTWSERGMCAMRVSRGHTGDTARVTVRAGPRLVWPHAAAMLVGGSLPVLAAGESVLARSADPAVAEVRLRAPPAPTAYPDLQMFTLMCNKRGETTLELLSQSDEDTDTGGSVSVACAPRVTRLKLDAVVPECPGGRVWVRAGSRVRIDVTLFDAAGRELGDEMGHRMSWELSPGHAGFWFANSDHLLVDTDPEYDPVPVPLRYYQELIANDNSAGWSGVIRATTGEASTTLQAQVVAPLTADPLYVSIAFEGSSSLVSTVTGGSGHYTVNVRKGATAVLDNGQLTATWPSPGRYEIVVTDNCLSGETVTIVARVEEVHSVEISGPRAICIGACVPFSASAHGVSGRDLSATATPDWRVSRGAELREGLLCGVREGTAVVKAAIAGVWSREIEVSVFPVLRLSPDRVRVPPGARLQLSYVGGPPARQASFHYAAVHKDDKITVQPNGLLNAHRVGTSRVRLVASDRDGAEIAHAEADVEVVAVSGVRGMSATQTALVGSSVPLWLSASPTLGPEALGALHPPPRVTWAVRDEAASLTVPLRSTQSADKYKAEGLAVRLTPLRDGPIIVDIQVDNFVQGGETRSFNTMLEIQAVPDLTTSIDNYNIDSGNIALAVGATVQLKSSLKARWVAVTSELPAFEITGSGEVKALREGFGVAIGRYRDEKSNYERETSVHIEVATPHYVTTQSVADDDGVAIRLEARSVLGIPLLGHNLTFNTQGRLHFHPRPSTVSGPEALVTGVDSSGVFTSVEADSGSSMLRDYVWMDSVDANSQRITAGGATAICLPGVGWRPAAGVWLGEGGGATLAVPQGRGRARLALEADRPRRTATIVQTPTDKLSFMSGEWPAALVPLAVDSADSAVLCSEQERSVLAELKPVLPFECRAEDPYTAEAVLDLYLGQVGCSVTSQELLTEPQETRVCADWDTLSACTAVVILPPVRVTADVVALENRRAKFVVTGHASALKSVTVTSSPGIKTSMESTPEGLEVTVWSDDRECGPGAVWVRAKRTAQTIRVQVSRECEVTCGSLLAIAVSLIRPYFSSLVSASVAAFGALFIYSKISNTNATKVAPSISPVNPVTPISPVSPARTWQRSPYAPPRPVALPPSPVYGDTTILPDNSYSPNSAQQHSRFL